jgi:predicted NBD/HSP70 family sugar kinase
MGDNRQAVLDAVLDHGRMSLREIEQRTGLGHTTVGALVAELRAQGALVTAEADRSQAPSGTGRPPMRVSLNPGLARVVGIQFEHTHVRAAIADLGFTIVARDLAYMPVADNAARSLAAGAEMIEALIGSAGVDRRQIIGVAMAVAAPIDAASGTVRATDALRGWVDLQPGVDLGRRLQLPVKVDNDATLAGFGEAVTGAARGSRHVVYVKLSATIGGGIVIDGRPYGGATGTAGELAHMVVDGNGALCFCGSRGCLHTVVDADAILRDLQSTHAKQLGAASGHTLDERLEMVIDWARHDDPACRRVLRDVAWRVGLALVNVCNLVNPETIVVGGVLSGAGDLLFHPLREWVNTYTRHLSPSRVRIVPPELGEWAEVLGAGALVVRSDTPAFRRRLEALINGSGSGSKPATRRPHKPRD